MKKLLFKFKSEKHIKIAAAVCICAAAAVIGVAASIAVKHRNKLTVNNTYDEMRISPQTRVRVVKNYSCGHCDTYKTDEYIGCSKTMLEAMENCSIEVMTDDYVCLVINETDCCDKHYMLRLIDGNKLCVFTTGLQSGRLTEILFDTACIDEAEYSKLTKGIVFDTLDEINAYIENIET